MFEKFRRRNRDGYSGNDYNDGTGFQRGDGYAEDQTATQPVGTRTAVVGRDTDGDGRPDAVDRDRTLRTSRISGTASTIRLSSGAAIARSSTRMGIDSRRMRYPLQAIIIATAIASTASRCG